LLWGWAARSGGNWSDAIFPMADGRPHEGQIVARLGWLCTGGKNEDFDFEALDDDWFAALCGRRASTPRRSSPSTTEVVPNASST